MSFVLIQRSYKFKSRPNILQIYSLSDGIRSRFRNINNFKVINLTPPPHTPYAT